MIENTKFHGEDFVPTYSPGSIAREMNEIGVIEGVRVFQRHDRHQVAGFVDMNPEHLRHVAVYRLGFHEFPGDTAARELTFRHVQHYYRSIDFTIQVYKLLIDNGWVIVESVHPCSESTQKLWQQLAKLDGAQVTICEFGDDGSIISEEVYDGGEFQNGYFLKLSGVKNE